MVFSGKKLDNSSSSASSPPPPKWKCFVKKTSKTSNHVTVAFLPHSFGDLKNSTLPADFDLEKVRPLFSFGTKSCCCFENPFFLDKIHEWAVNFWSKIILIWSVTIDLLRNIKNNYSTKIFYYLWKIDNKAQTSNFENAATNGRRQRN